MSNDFGDRMLRGVARIMVRQHLSDLVTDGIGTEDELVEALLVWLQRNSSVSMRDATFLFRLAVLEHMSRRGAGEPQVSIKTIGGGDG